MNFDDPLSTRRSRHTSFIVTAVAHLGVVGLFLMPTAQPVKSYASSLKMFDVPPSNSQAKQAPAKPEQPLPVPPPPEQAVLLPPPIIPLPVPSDMIVAMLAQSEADAEDGACDLTEPVRAALQESADVNARLPKMPRAHRSVANAVMIWDTDWVASENRLDTEALATIRDVVAGTVAAASPECRLQPQSGPRLLVLPGERENVVLAIGSGGWRWQDVLQTARPDWSDDALTAPIQQKLTLASADQASLRADERILSSPRKPPSTRAR